MAATWKVRQYGDEVYRFRDKECGGKDSALWLEILINFGILIEKGPVGAGPRIAKRLGGGDGIWELIAHLDNAQPRLLFYERPRPALSALVFVHCFIKKGKQDYGPAIKLAKQRRSRVEGKGGGGDSFLAPVVH